ncbi:MAG: hypothetical protein WD795_15670 [Woeseia sp.]
MITANTAIPRLTTQPATRQLSPPWPSDRPTLSSNRPCSLTDTGRPASPHFAYVPGLQIREEGEHYLPDLPRRADEKEYQADPGLSDAARAHAGNVRRALALLDDAINLVGVLLAAVEQDADARGAQARTVLEMAVERIHEAHRCVGDFEEVI